MIITNIVIIIIKLSVVLKLNKSLAVPVVPCVLSVIFLCPSETWGGRGGS